MRKALALMLIRLAHFIYPPRVTDFSIGWSHGGPEPDGVWARRYHLPADALPPQPIGDEVLPTPPQSESTEVFMAQRRLVDATDALTHAQEHADDADGLSQLDLRDAKLGVQRAQAELRYAREDLTPHG